ncbi:retinal guanylyl cyclase 2-like isoform X1 [Leptopilina heterotoma]|uniref:retinal guanylyl cyclase 2-like isoform X1 n=1 Tax=Leptopilina heterotoma TaxID=63436 RepID=UPI001CA80D52|nr:retinal guanylyl cyclase 2-like isoform X1 [Leptopilina heterotoma]
MARCWLRQCWWWFLLVTFLGWFLLPITNSSMDLETSAEILVFLPEICNRDFNTSVVQDFLTSRSQNLSIAMISKSQTCETRSWGLGALVQALEQNTTKALIADLNPNTCDVAMKLAHLWNKPLLTWNCPQRAQEDAEFSSIIRLSPSLLTMANSITEMFRHFRWKSVAIISSDDILWSNLDRAVVGALGNIGIVPRHRIVLQYSDSPKQIQDSLRPLITIPCRAVLFCLPLENNYTSRILVEMDAILQESRLSHPVIILIQPVNSDFFIPENISTATTTLPILVPFTSSPQSSNFSIPNVSDAQSNEPQRSKGGESSSRFKPPTNLSKAMLTNLLAVVPVDQTYDVQRIFSGRSDFTVPNIFEHLEESLEILIRDNTSLNQWNNKMFTFALLNLNENDWEPILIVFEQREQLVIKEIVQNTFADDEIIVLCENQGECSYGDLPGIPLRTAHIVAIIMSSLLFGLIAIVTAALIRRHLMKKRMSKGPYKIILTTSDFVFPQVPDPRRVDEGIEAMLCCWLQQLQDFGGPEVEKPDLLQGSVGSLRPHLQASNGSLARHAILNDPRVRYNGDLVQLKELQIQGTFELKSKAIDVLVTIHGLRHENLNPLIGCLNEPTRPCLVSEFCSRGSLEDVLVQDEIKLDWSFRLSLLTDLVRGMKYLHSTPVRVHGFLTSRNCVIDARWVLKVADYGLPAFYEAQNAITPIKTARDLLWTAPELLRHAGLRKRGTQAGDVYSFGIIMQEVVVRGEPFCMLALSPEDIIEKVKKPPPLIRPSVSKGAAPPEAINIMRQCWAEAADMRPDFNAVYDLFKKLNHGRKVNFVDTMFEMLEKYSNNLEELIRERTEQLDMEKKKTEQLLNRMLPASVAEKLKLGMPVDPEEFREVTIYFSDIVGFTTISAYSTPFQVVDLLNDLYTCFDATINAYTVYKVETIGDAYMVVGGCPVRIPDHASQVATMALDLLHQSGKFKLKHLPKTQLRLRIGLHTGPCCAGVVGLTMPRYCLFGDTVNTTSRMESTGAPWRIHMSQATRDRLTQVGGYYIEYRGRTDVKGKGKMPTYWLLGKQGFDKELPTPPPLGEDHRLEESLILGSLVNQDADLGSPKHPSPIAEDVSFEENNSLDNLPAIDQESLSSVKITASDNNTCVDKVDTKKVAVSVHNERTLTYSYSLKSSEVIDTPKDIVKTPDYSSATITKSTSGDNQTNLATPVSAAEVAAALLGASTTSLASVPGTNYRRHRRVGVFDQDDLSTPYNHYRCLSPNDHGKNSACRLLKRQFSLDRADEPAIIVPDQHSQRIAPRLNKQNSAGAANDLERIEEVPSTPGPQVYRHASMSLSVESLTMQ